MLLAHPGFYGIVAQDDDRIVGSNFADLRSSIAGIGPISIDPQVQDQGIGRKLMEAAIDHLASTNVCGIRLVQSAYNNRSLSLYTRLGFQTREPLSVIQGPALNIKFAGYDVRPAGEADIATCNHLCRRVHGFERGAELREAIGAHTALVVEHLGRITGYATDLGFFACRRRDKSGLEIADCRSAGVSRTGISAPDQKSRGFRLVPRERTQARHADDIDEYRVLQRTGGCVATLDPIVTTHSLAFAATGCRDLANKSELGHFIPLSSLLIPADPRRAWDRAYDSPAIRKKMAHCDPLPVAGAGRECLIIGA
jgi:GNAT superfamily N-acetyltransferase